MFRSNLPALLIILYNEALQEVLKICPFFAWRSSFGICFASVSVEMQGYSCWVFEGIYIFQPGRGTSVSCQLQNFPQLLSHYMKTTQVTNRPGFSLPEQYVWTAICYQASWLTPNRCMPSPCTIWKGAESQTKVRFLIHRTTCFQENPGASWLLSSFFLLFFSFPFRCSALKTRKERGFLMVFTDQILLLLVGGWKQETGKLRSVWLKQYWKICIVLKGFFQNFP